VPLPYSIDIRFHVKKYTALLAAHSTALSRQVSIMKEQTTVLIILLIPIVLHCESEKFVEVGKFPHQNSTLAAHCPWVHLVLLVLAAQLAEEPPSHSQGSHHTTQQNKCTLTSVKEILFLYSVDFHGFYIYKVSTDLLHYLQFI
jgi:hypothetical protein